VSHLQVMGELHKEELKSLFREANTRTVVIKLLDTALGKFLPTTGKHHLRTLYLLIRRIVTNGR